jgi:hypothetical protein
LDGDDAAWRDWRLNQIKKKSLRSGANKKYRHHRACAP